MIFENQILILWCCSVPRMPWSVHISIWCRQLNVFHRPSPLHSIDSWRYDVSQCVPCCNFDWLQSNLTWVMIVYINNSIQLYIIFLNITLLPVCNIFLQKLASLHMIAELILTSLRVITAFVEFCAATTMSTEAATNVCWIFFIIFANWTAACSMIGYWHHAVVFLSICLSVCETALWLDSTSSSKSVWTSE